MTSFKARRAPVQGRREGVAVSKVGTVAASWERRSGGDDDEREGVAMTRGKGFGERVFRSILERVSEKERVWSRSRIDNFIPITTPKLKK